ncbi:hypothetical protein ACFQJ7_07565 [Halovenus rubra]|uniref:Major facilitator superfamily (MFS) profile domain-containing protein n=2 Tax=Halovenus rubra TaxID=869890 RepID=A0ABD5XAB9_9EURY|nr:hypothetical protein [Halovenus rubra]
MTQYSTTNYAKLAKSGFFLGIALFVSGALGGIIAPGLQTPVPGWEHTLFLYAEIIGTVVGFFSPLVFGVVLPLVD